jgi:hypothetical protein
MNLFLEGPAKLIENSDLFKARTDGLAGRLVEIGVGVEGWLGSE